ncbi:MAG: hypothetical protein ACLR8Y_18870 [Alistipes indistinctus]
MEAGCSATWGTCIAQSWFLQPELLMDDRGQQRDEVLLTVTHMAFVRNARSFRVVPSKSSGY